ncbi:Glutathione S-transferase [Roseivivax jejudonensis]|uniref:Glutathione S-transferase n=1 Tax=Roseivivax jejudonensis TaxID=1529041 RepID=A0A1X6ZIG7_9RHOB|nr:glutathione S-transferase family protein [Roseivivax jejudonensis]SLN50601.1 Glutathione S-transferase [Roseivivax jejudonensis]
MSRYRLHYAPDNASLAVRLALEELGQSYETVLVDRAARAQAQPAFRRVNPAGRIPALETPQGPIFETAAILLHLADTHGALAPRPDAADRGIFLSHLFFLSNTVQAELRLLAYPETYVGREAPAAAAALRARVKRNLSWHLDLVEAAAGAGHGWLGAEVPSVADLLLACLLRWFAIYPPGETGWYDLSGRPALRRVAARVETREAARRAAAAEGLGPSPFTAPELPDPPEGSAV